VSLTSSLDVSNRVEPPEQEGKNLNVPVIALCPFLHNVTITVAEETGLLHKWVLESPVGGLLSQEVTDKVSTERYL
jgi:hypothetical protein